MLCLPFKIFRWSNSLFLKHPPPDKKNPPHPLQYVKVPMLFQDIVFT